MLGSNKTYISQFIGEGWTGPVANHVYKQMKNHVSSHTQEVKAQVQECGARRAWGSSGTIINLAEIASKMFKKNGNGSGGTWSSPEKTSRS